MARPKKHKICIVCGGSKKDTCANCKKLEYEELGLDRKRERRKFLESLHAVAKTTGMESFTKDITTIEQKGLSVENAKAIDETVKKEIGDWK